MHFKFVLKTKYFHMPTQYLANVHENCKCMVLTWLRNVCTSFFKEKWRVRQKMFSPMRMRQKMRAVPISCRLIKS